MSKAKPSRNNPKVAQSNPTVKYVPKQSSGNSKWIYLSLALTFLIYLPYMHNGLTNADDQQAIVENELIHQINLSAIVQMFQSYQLGMYAPVTQVLLSIGYALGGGSATPFHFISLFLHMLNGYLVFKLLSRMSFSSTVSVAAASIFLLHPVNTQLVAWVSGVSATLCATFYLGACVVYAKWMDTKDRKWLIQCFAFFVLALLSKSAAVTLPLILGLIHWWKNRESGFIQSQLKQVPFFILSLIFGILTFISRNAEGQNIIIDSPKYTTSDRVWMVLETLQFYIYKLILPFNLAIHYPFLKENAWPWYFYVAPITIAIIAFVIWKMRNKEANLLLIAGWFIFPVLVMLPLLTVGNFELKGDRYIYISSISFALLLSIALLNSSKISASVGRSVLVGILCIYAFLIYQRREVWSDSIHLWTEAIEREPKGPVPYNNRGASYFEENQTDAALLDFQSAIAISPEYTNALFNLGNAEAKKGLYPQAILHFDKAIALKPNYKNAWRNRGNCKHMLGNDAEACADWNEAKNQGHQGVDRALSLYCH